jgi:hypothetical protein
MTVTVSASWRLASVPTLDTRLANWPFMMVSRPAAESAAEPSTVLMCAMSMDNADTAMSLDNADNADKTSGVFGL